MQGCCHRASETAVNDWLASEATNHEPPPLKRWLLRAPKTVVAAGELGLKMCPEPSKSSLFQMDLMILNGAYFFEGVAMGSVPFWGDPVRSHAARKALKRTYWAPPTHATSEGPGEISPGPDFG